MSSHPTSLTLAWARLSTLLLLLQIIVFTVSSLRLLGVADAFVPFIARHYFDGASIKIFHRHRQLCYPSRRSIIRNITRPPVTINQNSLSLNMQQHGGNNKSFASFLDSTSSASIADSISNSNYAERKKNVILGNQAGDADSIISALTLGYIMSSISSSDTLQVPIVSISRAEMELRRDAVLLLDLAGICIQTLLYVDDDIVTNHLLPLSSLPSDSSMNIGITLVDHNKLRPIFSHLNSLVTEIVDHHKDEGYHEHVSSEYGKRNIAFENSDATVASTCTLVAERLFESMPDDSLESSIDGALGLSLLGVILLDSINMLPDAKKGTPRDEAAIQQLLKCTDWASLCKTVPSLIDEATIDKIFPNGRCNMPDRHALFDLLIGAKSDPNFWSKMSAINCFRIDYKKFIVDDTSSIGLSSVLIRMDDLLAKEGFVESMKAFIVSEDLNLFGILGVTFVNDKTKRELLLACYDDNVVDSLSQFLLEHPDAAAMDFVEREDCRDYMQDISIRIRVFRQGNPQGSRKQIAPLILQHVSKKKSL